MSAPASIAELAARLCQHADMDAAFGDTPAAHDMRLAASVLIQFEQQLNDAYSDLRAQILELQQLVNR